MDTGLRAGKIVYSQACFILDLNNLSRLLLEIGQTDSAKRMLDIPNKTKKGIEERLWSEIDGSYVDYLESRHIGGGPYGTITQGVTLYLIAVSENTTSDTMNIYQYLDNSKIKNYRNQIEQKKGW